MDRAYKKFLPPDVTVPLLIQSIRIHRHTPKCIYQSSQKKKMCKPKDRDRLREWEIEREAVWKNDAEFNDFHDNYYK